MGGGVLERGDLAQHLGAVVGRDRSVHHALEADDQRVSQGPRLLQRSVPGEDGHAQHAEEEGVDDRGGERGEVVVLAGDELADLVDEQSRPGSGARRRRSAASR
jgi:hypothetical protein